MKPFIRIKNRIIGVDHIHRITVAGPDWVNVYMSPGNSLEQFHGEEARALLEILDLKYVDHSRTDSEKSKSPLPLIPDVRRSANEMGCVEIGRPDKINVACEPAQIP